MRDPSVWSHQEPVPHDILVASGVPEIFSAETSQENQAVVDYLCLWEDRDAFLEYLLGSGVNGPAPLRHPVRYDLMARRAVINGISPTTFDGTFAAYQYAKVNVTFKFVPAGGGPIVGDLIAIISIQSESAGEYMTIPNRQLKWDAGPSDGKPLIEPPHKFIPIKRHTVTIHQWYNPPFGAMDVAQGNINSLGVTWIGRTIAAKNLLFESYNESFDITRYGITPFKVEMSFKEKIRSWNKFLASDTLFYDVTPAPYVESSFAGIFP